MAHNIENSGTRDSEILFSALGAPGVHKVHRHTCKQNAPRKRFYDLVFTFHLIFCAWGVWIWMCIWGQRTASLLPPRASSGRRSGPHPWPISSLLSETSSSPTPTSVCYTHGYKCKQIQYWLHYMRVLLACLSASHVCTSVGARRRCQSRCTWSYRQLLAAAWVRGLNLGAHRSTALLTSELSL